MQSLHGKLTLGKIIEIVATTCHILKLKCTNLDFPNPLGGAYIAPRPLAGFTGLYC